MTFLPIKPPALNFRVGKIRLTKYIKDSFSLKRIEFAICNILSMLDQLANNTISKSVVISEEITLVNFLKTELQIIINWILVILEKFAEFIRGASVVVFFKYIVFMVS